MCVLIRPAVPYCKGEPQRGLKFDLLHSTAQHCIVSTAQHWIASTAQHCIALHCTALYCLHCKALYCLNCTALYCLHCTALYCLHCTTLYCLHCTALNCLHCTAFIVSTAFFVSILQECLKLDLSHWRCHFIIVHHCLAIGYQPRCIAVLYCTFFYYSLFCSTLSTNLILTISLTKKIIDTLTKHFKETRVKY